MKFRNFLKNANLTIENLSTINIKNWIKLHNIIFHTWTEPSHFIALSEILLSLPSNHRNTQVKQKFMRRYSELLIRMFSWFLMQPIIIPHYYAFSIVVKGFSKSRQSAAFIKRIFLAHIKKFFSFVNDFLMFSRLSGLLLLPWCFAGKKSFFFSFFKHNFLFSLTQQLKVKIDVCLLNFDSLFKKNSFNLRINGNFMKALYILTNTKPNNNDAIVAWELAYFRCLCTWLLKIFRNENSMYGQFFSIFLKLWIFWPKLKFDKIFVIWGLILKSTVKIFSTRGMKLFESIF